MKEVVRIAVVTAACFLIATVFAQERKGVQTGQAAFTDAAHEAPGIRRHLTVADLPAPAPDQSVDNGAPMIARPADAWPKAPNGFKVELYATGFDNPREMRTAPNGDIFLAESETGKIKVVRGVTRDGKAEVVSEFAEGLHQPFGIAFYPAVPTLSTSMSGIRTRSCGSLIRTGI
jgi:glucose/arabinose dehydrogenase